MFEIVLSAISILSCDPNKKSSLFVRNQLFMRLEAKSVIWSEIFDLFRRCYIQCPMYEHRIKYITLNASIIIIIFHKLYNQTEVSYLIWNENTLSESNPRCEAKYSCDLKWNQLSEEKCYRPPNFLFLASPPPVRLYRHLGAVPSTLKTAAIGCIIF